MALYQLCLPCKAVQKAWLFSCISSKMHLCPILLQSPCCPENQFCPAWKSSKLLIQADKTISSGNLILYGLNLWALMKYLISKRNQQNYTSQLCSFSSQAVIHIMMLRVVHSIKSSLTKGSHLTQLTIGNYPINGCAIMWSTFNLGQILSKLLAW